MQDATPLGRAVGARALIVLHPPDGVRALPWNGRGREGLVALEGSELVVEVKFPTIGSVLQVWNRLFDGVEIDLAVPDSRSLCRSGVQPRVGQQKPQPKVSFETMWDTGSTRDKNAIQGLSFGARVLMHPRRRATSIPDWALNLTVTGR